MIEVLVIITGIAFAFALLSFFAAAGDYHSHPTDEYRRVAILCLWAVPISLFWPIAVPALGIWYFTRTVREVLEGHK